MRLANRLGCIGAIALAGVLVVYLATTRTGEYLFATVFLYGAILVASVLPSTLWHESEAHVVKATIYDSQNFGIYGSMTLDYRDGDGTDHRQTLRVLSRGNGLKTVAAGDVLSVRVCNTDSALIQSIKFTVPGQAKCSSAPEPGTASQDGQ